MIDITLLGTAATMPLPERALTAVHLSFSGRSILFDCGEGTQTAARKAHVSLMKTDLIALTHYHGDHFFGLPGLLQTFGCLGRTDPLIITGPDGLEEAMQPILQLSGSLPFSVSLFHLPQNGIYLSDLIPHWGSDAMLIPVPTRHRVESQGYRFSLRRPGKFNPAAAIEHRIPQKSWSLLQRGNPVTLEDGTVVLPQQILGPDRKGLNIIFTGDTAPCDTLVEAASGADLLICEATYGDDELASQAEKYGHCTFSQAAHMAEEACVKRLWLTHFSQIMENPEDCLPFAQKIFPEAVCGTDGMKITLRYSDDMPLPHRP